MIEEKVENEQTVPEEVTEPEEQNAAPAEADAASPETDSAVVPEVCPQQTCRNCGAPLEEGQSFCAKCGTGNSVGPIFCSNCGRELSPDTSFCPHCGTQLAAASSTAVPNQKKRKLYILIGAAAAVAVIALSVVFRKIPVEQIKLSETSVKLMEEEAVNISCDVFPENATNKAVEWNSSDEEIATVDQYGRITGIKKGTCKVTVSAGDVDATLDITVTPKLPDLQAIYDELCKSAWADIGSDGSYLSVDTNPYNKDDGDWSYLFTVNSAIKDIHEKLGLPESLYQDMNKTTWSMGKQEEIFENLGLRVTWTYHPDKGLEVTYKLLLD